jgi:hypothetical protein
MMTPDPNFVGWPQVAFSVNLTLHCSKKAAGYDRMKQATPEAGTAPSAYSPTQASPVPPSLRPMGVCSRSRGRHHRRVSQKDHSVPPWAH